MRIAAILIPAAMLLAQTPSAEVPAPFQSVGTMSELMLDVIYPTSDQIFYVSRDEQKNEKDWIALRRNALIQARNPPTC